MLFAPIPFDEAQRLDAVHRLQILDTNPEERFDRITRIVHHLFDVPSVFITLVDNKRLWFKSMYGCDVREESRDVSFCGHTINNIVTEDFSSRLFEVLDTEQDDRFYDNSLIIEKFNVSYYIGFVLQSKDHRNIGTLCMTDTRPRTFSENQKKLFADLGLMAEAELNNYRTSSDNYADKLLNLTATLESVQKQFNESLKKHDTNYKEWRILNEIIQAEFPSPHLISQKLGIAPPLMTRKLDTLEIKRLIERWHSKDGDRRFVHLACSKRGRDLWRKGLEEADRLGQIHLENIIC
jgi:DNA-binding MarR family transcriptional regulator